MSEKELTVLLHAKTVLENGHYHHEARELTKVIEREAAHARIRGRK